jgi:predicted DNA-binding ribbon-helix-helix protein
MQVITPSCCSEEHRGTFGHIAKMLTHGRAARRASPRYGGLVSGASAAVSFGAEWRSLVLVRKPKREEFFASVTPGFNGLPHFRSESAAPFGRGARIGADPMKAGIMKRSIVIAGHKTSVSLEDAFWSALKEIADSRHMRISDLVARIDADRKHSNLSSAIRLFVLAFYRDNPERRWEAGNTAA